MKRDAIEQNHCSFQKSSVDVRNYVSVLATLMTVINKLQGNESRLFCLAAVHVVCWYKTIMSRDM